MKSLVMVVLLAVILAGCTAQTPNPYAKLGTDIPAEGETGELHYEAQVGTQNGEKAPDFTLTTIDGETVTLSELDKPVLLFFWTTWCPACLHDIGVMQTLYQNYRDDVVILAINMDKNENEERIKEFVPEHEIPGVLWADSDELLKTYNVLYTSTKVAIGRDGIVLWRGSGELSEEYFVTLFEGLKNS